MTKPRPLDPAWEELRELEHRSVWDRFYERFDFHASVHPEDWPSFVEPPDSMTWDISPVLDARSHPDLEAEVAGALRDGIVRVMGDDDFVYALDWQHPSYRFRPALASSRPDTWRVAALPDGDYALFVASDFRFGWLAHPWEQSICVFGELLDAVSPFMTAQPWPVLRSGGEPHRSTRIDALPARGRIAQDTSFLISGLHDVAIDKVLVTELDTPGTVQMVWLHVQGRPHWHRVFGDAGILFWDEYEEDDAFADFEDVVITDETRRLGIGTATIESVQAIDGTLTIATRRGDVIIELLEGDGLRIHATGAHGPEPEHPPGR